LKECPGYVARGAWTAIAIAGAWCGYLFLWRPCVEVHPDNECLDEGNEGGVGADDGIDNAGENLRLIIRSISRVVAGVCEQHAESKLIDHGVPGAMPGEDERRPIRQEEQRLSKSLLQIVPCEPIPQPSEDLIQSGLVDSVLQRSEESREFLTTVVASASCSHAD
jgi:hypothetical protein